MPETKQQMPETRQQMPAKKQTPLKSRQWKAVLVSVMWLCVMIQPPQAGAIETWEKVDKRIKGQIYHLNVGLKLRLKDSLWCHIADLSTKYRFPVYSTSTDDKGFRVVGFGSSFPVKTLQHDKNYFLTCRHVLETAAPIVQECIRFYAAMRLYAEQTGGGNPDARFNQLLQIVNLSVKPGLRGQELAHYQQTANAIWDVYENNLSTRADPGRVLFKKYASLAKVEAQVGYFLRSVGPSTQKPLEATLYKIARRKDEPDLAILTVGGASITPMELDLMPPTEGQEIQVVGYPKASEQIDLEADHYYAPTFASGRVSRVVPRSLQVDASTTVGNSGGPVVSLRGKVLGVIARRAMSESGGELPNFAVADPAHQIQSFAPELFGRGPISRN